MRSLLLRSTLAVGKPLDLVVVPADAREPITERRIGVDDAYFNDLSIIDRHCLGDRKSGIDRIDRCVMNDQVYFLN